MMILISMIFLGIVALIFLYSGAIWDSKNKSKDIKEIIVPDKVDANESTLKSTQNEEAKRYVVDMNNTKIEKNVVKNGQIVRKENNSIEYNEIDNFIEEAVEQEYLAKIEKVLLDAEDAIKTKTTFVNNKIDDTTIVLRLFKKYGINVPIKTQGWINKALARIFYKDGEISYSYLKTSNDSTVFYEYLKELENKILAA